MPNDKTEVVPFELPDGSIQRFEIPAGLSDAEARTFVLSKRPDLFQKVPDALKQAQAMFQPGGRLSIGKLPKEQGLLPGLGGTAFGAEAPEALTPKQQQAIEEVPGIVRDIAFASIPASKVLRAIPSVKRAGEARNAIRAIIGKAPVQVTDEMRKIASTALEYKQAGSTLPMPFRAFMRRVGMMGKAPGPTSPIGSPAYNQIVLWGKEAAAGDDVALKALQKIAKQTIDLEDANFARHTLAAIAERPQTQTPILFEEAEKFMTNFSRLSADELNKLQPVMLRQVSMFSKALKESMAQTAGQAGLREAFLGAMKETHQAKALASAGKSIVKKAIPAGIGAYILNRILSGR